jgi:hypothetical protein
MKTLSKLGALLVDLYLYCFLAEHLPHLEHFYEGNPVQRHVFLTKNNKILICHPEQDEKITKKRSHATGPSINN